MDRLFAALRVTISLPVYLIQDIPAATDTFSEEVIPVVLIVP